MARIPIDNLLSIPESDYLVVAGYKYPYEQIQDWKNQIYLGMADAHEIKKNSCLDFLLKYFVENTGPEPMVEIIPYKILMLDARKEGWPETSVRRNTRRLEDLGIVGLYDFNNPKYLKRTELLRQVGRKYRWRKFVASKLAIPITQFEEAAKTDTIAMVSFIRGMSEEEIKAIDRKRYEIIRKVDLRGLDVSERARIVSEMVDTYKMFEKNRKPLSKEERAKILSDATEKLKRLPDVERIYLVGSMSNNRFRERSDIDLMVILSPTSDENNGNLRKTTKSLNDAIDLFSFTKEQYQELLAKRKLIAHQAVLIHERNLSK